MKILVINPRLIVHTRMSADEQERLYNITDLTELGHEVRLITRPTTNRSFEETVEDYRQRKISTRLVGANYPRVAWKRFTEPGFADGAAWAFAAPDFEKALSEEFKTFKPDVIWAHTSYSWPVARYAQRYNIPTVVRSVNYEAVHFRHGYHGQRLSLVNYFRFVAKALGEIRATQYASVLVAITPNEQRQYQKLNKHTYVEQLPLRALPYYIVEKPVFRDRSPLHVYFMGANFKFPHNRVALLYLVNEIIPCVREKMPGQFVFHVTGAKSDLYVSPSNSHDLIFHQYINDLDGFLADMDIALAPSLVGTGMQQKVFEPVCRGFPTVTHRRSLAGYDLEDGKHILLVDDIEGFLYQLKRLRNPDFRREIAGNALDYAKQHFAKDVVRAKVKEILELALR